MEFDDPNDWQTPEIELKKRTRIILKNIPRDLNADGLKHMCKRYGKIADIRWPNEQNYAFVSFELPA